MLQAISIANKPKVLDNIIWRRDGESDQIIVLSKDNLALPLILNPTAARIFSLCDGRNTVEDIAQALSDEFGVEDFKIALEDVKGQIGYFIDKEIVQV